MNYLSTLNYGYRLLKSNNIISYKLDSELLLASALNKTREINDWTNTYKLSS